MESRSWWDYFRIFSYAFTEDPLSKFKHRDMSGAGISQSGAIPDLRAGQDGTFGEGRGTVRLRDTNDFVDLSTVTNRIHRCKEYERLRNMPEIEMAMTVFADEACVSGDTLVATPHGYKKIKDLVKEKERFLVYCYDFTKKDYTLGWAYDVRKTKTAKTIKVFLDNGETLVCTPDHRVLLKNGTWSMAEDLEVGSKLMPFYRLSANQSLTKLKTNQYARIFTNRGWIHERQFVDEWSLGKQLPEFAETNKYGRLIAEGLTARQLMKVTGNEFVTIKSRLEKVGFSMKELQWLGKKKDERRVIGIQPWEEIDVYDLTVDKHHNFCTNWGVLHNCQRDEEGRVFQITCENTQIKEELEYLFFHKKMLNLDQKRVWDVTKRLFIMGDFFWEIVIDLENPKKGILNLVPLPPDTVYRIETTKGKLLEFQQSKEGPDYQSLARVEVTQATDADLQQATAIRFAPDQIIHIKIGDDRETFYPYGVSLIEAARGPAHQLRIMEDSMVVYRLCLTGYVRIRTPKGWKYIKDIQEGDTVYTLTPDQTLVETKVSWFVNNGLQEILKVRSQHIEISGTKTHPLLVNRDGVEQYVDMQDLRPKKDKLINFTHDREESVAIPRIFGETRAKLPNDLIGTFGEVSKKYNVFANRIGITIPMAEAVKFCEKYNLSESQLILSNKGEIKPERINLPEEVTEDFARLFGFLLGDGSVTNNQVVFTAGMDQEQNIYYAGLLEKFFGKVGFSADKRSKHDCQGNYTVSSRYACKILKSMGYIPGAHNKRIPSWVFNAKKSIRKAFVQGLADADGCQRYTDAGLWFCTIEMCNLQLVEDIKEIWHGIGLCSGKVKTRTRAGGHEISPGHLMKSTVCHSVTITERKLPKYENIWSVEPAGEELVYDFTVDHNQHNFIANGTCSANSRAPERRVFYIDTFQLPPYKAEAFVERMKSQFKKKKVPNTRQGLPGASSVEERWHAPAADEDFWIPIRPNSQTRVDTLPGAQNLGEVDDTIYFRNKLFTALNFPKNYFNNEDVQSTRISLSAQDIKFARMIERLQSHIEDALEEIATRHLILRGFPEESYEDLKIKMTIPSDHRELTKAEVLASRIQNAGAIKGSMLMSDHDILTKIMLYAEEESLQMEARLKLQKLEDLKLQIIAQNPTLLGVGLPGPDETELGAEPGGPNPMLGDEEPPNMGGNFGEQPGGPPGGNNPPPIMGDKKPHSGTMIAQPTEDDIRRFNLDIKDFASEMDEEWPEE